MLPAKKDIETLPALFTRRRCIMLNFLVEQMT